VDEHVEMNYVNNYLLAGPSSTSSSAFLGGALSTAIYQSGNLLDTDKDGRVDGVNTGWSMFTGSYTQTNSPFPVPALTAETSGSAYQRVLAQAGAMPWRRDPNDQRIAATVRRQYGSVVDFVGPPNQPTEYVTNTISGTNFVGVRGWPTLASESAPTDSDADGMPDFWELALGWNPNNASDRNVTNAATGYTRLEDYLNWLAEPHAACGRNGPVDINLRTLNGGATNLAFSVSNGTNGTVSLLPDGYMARFVPAANFSGVASFNYTATESTNGLGFGPAGVGVLVSITNAPNANNAPALEPLSNQVVIAGTTVSITNSANDVDMPAQVLTFSLAAGPTNASLNPANGLFTWRPLITQSPSTNPIAIVVTDNGLPALSDTQTCLVTVASPAPAKVGAIPTPGGITLEVTGDAGPDYAVQGSSNLLTWDILYLTNSPLMPFLWTDTNLSNLPQRFYRIKAGPPL
jgi:hypothetical protein